MDNPILGNLQIGLKNWQTLNQHTFVSARFLGWLGPGSTPTMVQKEWAYDHQKIHHLHWDNPRKLVYTPHLYIDIRYRY